MKLTMTGTGDSILIQGYPRGGYPGFDAVRDFICRGQARFGNLETCVTAWDTYCSQYSGGTWMNAEPRMLPMLLDFGFNFLGFANNHTMDMGPDGLLETLEHLGKYDVAVAGAGANLAEASQAVYRDLPGGRVALIAVSATFNPAAAAGDATKILKGRPGVNALRHSSHLYLNQEHLDQMTKIAEITKINGSADLSRRSGFTPPLAAGTAAFGALTLKLSPDGREYVHTACDKRDMNRILGAIRDAKLIADCVVVMFHCHDILADSHEENPEYAEEFCRAVIDGGADAVLGGGTHQFKPIEIYRGKPILYSMGNFCFQSNMVEHQSADMLDKYRIGSADEYSGPRALAARNKDWTIGHHTQDVNFLSVIPYLEFEDGKLVKLELMPIGLGFDKPRTFKGIPYPADPEESDKIFETLSRLSAPYGTKLTRDEKGIIHISL